LRSGGDPTGLCEFPVYVRVEVQRASQDAYNAKCGGIQRDRAIRASLNMARQAFKQFFRTFRELLFSHDYPFGVKMAMARRAAQNSTAEMTI